MKTPDKPRSGRRGGPVSLYALTPDQAIKGMFAIKPDDVKKLFAERPGKRRK